MRHVEKIVKLNFNNVIHKTCILKQQGFNSGDGRSMYPG